ncbi:MAG: PorV/PorQ family protein [Candidatus Margulisiibacteriota bacterium]
MRYYLLFLCLLLAVTTVVNGAVSPASFLYVPIGAREAALGGAGVALADTPVAAYWNPAGIALLKRQGAHSMFYTDPFDNKYLFANYVTPVGAGAIGISFFNLRTDDILNVPVLVPTPDNPYPRPYSDGTFTDSASYWMFTYGRMIERNLYAGLSLKMLSHQLYNRSASGTGIDMGLLYSPVEQFRFGVNIQNILPASMVWNTNNTETLPMNIKIGISIIATDYLFSSEINMREGQLRWSTGIETWLSPVFAVRAGFDRSSYSVGTSLRSAFTQLDIAMIKLTDSLLDDIYYQISLSAEFGDIVVPQAPSAQQTSRKSRDDITLLDNNKFNAVIFPGEHNMSDETYNYLLYLFRKTIEETRHFNVYNEDFIEKVCIQKKVPKSDLYDTMNLWETASAIDLDLIIILEAVEERKEVKFNVKFFDVRTREDYHTGFTRSISNTTLLQRTFRKVAEKLAVDRYPLLED